MGYLQVQEGDRKRERWRVKSKEEHIVRETEQEEEEEESVKEGGRVGMRGKEEREEKLNEFQRE